LARMHNRECCEFLSADNDRNEIDAVSQMFWDFKNFIGLTFQIKDTESKLEFKIRILPSKTFSIFYEHQKRLLSTDLRLKW
jgi:hypothetical protein